MALYTACATRERIPARGLTSVVDMQRHTREEGKTFSVTPTPHRSSPFCHHPPRSRRVRLLRGEGLFRLSQVAYALRVEKTCEKRV